MRRLVHMTGRHRAPSIDRLLGLVLAFVAGAVNAGGFLAVHAYTSHMTGFVSTFTDSVILGNVAPLLGAVGALASFTCGAAATAIIVNWANRHAPSSSYALPLLLEATLLLLFGLLGAQALGRPSPFVVPSAVLLLAFVMGLQNAVISKISSSQIRTTHMTGVITDLGIELGKLAYWNGAAPPATGRVLANRVRLRLLASLLGMFVVGGLIGAAGFKHLGFISVAPLAVALLLLSLPPLVHDLRRSALLHGALRRASDFVRRRPR